MNDSKESYKFDLGVEGLSSCTPLIMSHRPYYMICFFYLQCLQFSLQYTRQYSIFVEILKIVHKDGKHSKLIKLKGM